MLHEIIENNGSVRVLDYLVQEPELDFSTADVSRRCNVSWIKASEILQNFEELGLIAKSRTINRAKLYKIVIDSQILRNAKHLDLSIADLVNERTAVKELKQHGEIYATREEVLAKKKLD
jgi:hypothetical protein